jgi:peptidyl-prolyl cis-trans isomerase SurA
VAKSLNRNIVLNIATASHPFPALSRSLLAVLCISAMGLSTLSATAYAAPVRVTQPLNRVVAIVDDSVILSSEVDEAMHEAKKQIESHGQPLPSDDVLRVDVVRQLILRKIQLGIIARNGLSIDDATLNQTLDTIAKQQGSPTLEAFKAKLNALKPNGYETVRRQVSEDLSINRLHQQRISSRIKISDQDITNFLNSPQSADALKTEYSFTVIQVPITNSKDPSDVARATAAARDVKQQLDAGKSLEVLVAKYQLKGGDQGWHKPEELPTPFVEVLSKLKPNEYSPLIATAQGVDILQLNDVHGGNVATMVHQYHVRHILIKPNAIVSPEQAKLKIDDLYSKLKAGASFPDMAKAYSDDPGSAQNGGDLTWVSPGEMVPAFEAVMTHAPIGQISEPFQSQFGWHILLVDATRDQNMTEQYRKEAARQALYQRQFPVELDNWLREIRAAAYVDLREGANAP